MSHTVRVRVGVKVRVRTWAIRLGLGLRHKPYDEDCLLEESLDGSQRENAQTLQYPLTEHCGVSAIEDFPDWGKRLSIYGIDLRDIKAVEAYTSPILNSDPRVTG